MIEQPRMLNKTPKSPLVGIFHRCQGIRNIEPTVVAGFRQYGGSSRVREGMNLPPPDSDVVPVGLVQRRQPLENRPSVVLCQRFPVKIRKGVVPGKETMKECIRGFFNDDARIVRLGHKPPFPARARVLLPLTNSQYARLPGIDQKRVTRQQL